MCMTINFKIKKEGRCVALEAVFMQTADVTLSLWIQNQPFSEDYYINAFLLIKIKINVVSHVMTPLILCYNFFFFSNYIEHLDQL